MNTNQLHFGLCCMRYREHKVAPILAKHIECIWLLESDDEPISSTPQRLLPDGCIELILNFSDRFREHKQTGQSYLQPQRFVVGQMTRPMLVSPTGRVEILGIRFAPGGTLPFFSCPPGELTNSIAPLADVATTLEKELSDRLYEARDWTEKIRLLETALIKLLLTKEDGRASLQGAISRIIRAGGQTSVDLLANDLGISGRQLERRFLKEVGLGPKLLCRILRFQQVFRAVESDDPNWARIATDCGYYDQAHLIRDFRQFAEQTPSLLFEQFSSFTEAFTRKNRMSDFYNPQA